MNGLRNLNEHLGNFAPPVRLAAAGGKLTVAELLDTTAQDRLLLPNLIVFLQAKFPDFVRDLSALASSRPITEHVPFPVSR